MRIEVHLHPPFTQVVGTRTLPVELPDGASLLDLIERLRVDYPNLFPSLRSPEREEEVRSFAIFVGGGEVLPLSYKLREGEVIEIYPPLSGGVVPKLVQKTRRLIC
ncbi:MAG: MoaD/ThiS family protein [Armatimonadota bacterium]|nr:MoaD/ThiS family protein [Armatimonadota bacterium]